MTLYTGPAIGARAQMGFTQEGAWGCQQQSATSFIEMTGETIVSEIGALVSNALRPDRAVHKRISGVEAAGGDAEAEIAPTGFETWFKQALGDIATSRIDNAFIIEDTSGTLTECMLSVTHTAGLATRLLIEMNTGDIDLDLTAGANDTIGEVMALINLDGSLSAYSLMMLSRVVGPQP
jgi:hypothetical protein